MVFFKTGVVEENEKAEEREKKEEKAEVERFEGLNK